MTLNDFLTQLRAIADEKPTYRLGGDGSDGTCDCIGAIIGACRRCGLRWKGIHGTNWTARYATRDMSRIPSAASLALGDLVYKVRSPGERRYALPRRYAAHFDDKDYYHIGVVVQKRPLRILHCTSPGGFTTDKRLGSWRYHGQLSLISEDASAAPVPELVIPATVRYGSRGDTVVQLQQLLRAEGYHLQPDGIFGSMTREAVRSYQTAHGLAVDGIVGKKTWTALLQGDHNRKDE